MKIALLSDIHANRQALETCLQHARAQGAEQFALLGDLVGYGGEPVAVVEQVRDLVQQGALCVLGNHDAMALAPPANPRNRSELGAQWTHDQLGNSHIAFLQSLPLTARLSSSALLVHASADMPAQWRYVEDSNAAERSMTAAQGIDPAIRYVFSGHVHEQVLYFLTPTAKLMRFAPEPGVPVPVPPHRQWLAIGGAVGQPRDGSPKAMYTLYDSEQSELTFPRVAYDHHAAADAIRRAGLPDFFADRLEIGR